jgi:hypothetical protein
MDDFAPGSLLAHLAQVPDPRDPKGCRFRHTALLAAACAALLCGAKSFDAIAQWARLQPARFLHRLGFYRHPPTSGAYRYLFVGLDVAALEAALTAWATAALGEEAATLRPTALDGKTARGSADALGTAVHLLALFDQPTGGVLKQQAVGRTTNEHKAALTLLEGLVLDGRVVTGDAMFCHRDVADAILGAGGHYFFAVKDNQPTLLADLAAAFEPPFSPA